MVGVETNYIKYKNVVGMFDTIYMYVFDTNVRAI
jgi:hypothetical protein